MATEGRATIHTVELSLAGGATVGHVLLYPSARFVAEPASSIAGVALRASEKAWNRTGHLMPWLEMASLPDAELGRLVYTLEGRKGVEPLDLRFDLVILDQGEGILVHVPALQVSTWTVDRDKIEAVAHDLVRLEFARNKRLESGARVLASQLYDMARVENVEVSPSFYTFGELRALREAEQRSVVKALATPLRVSRAAAFGVEAAVTDLSRAVATHHAVVLVGPVGSGKSALVHDALWRGAFSGRTVWRTTAGRMERALTESGGWQQELTGAVSELSKSGDWLYVEDLAELFEVGRYVGNDTSIGEALRSPLSDRELHLVTECTPERLAYLDARYPGLIPLFVQVEVHEPPEHRRAAIVQRRLDQASPGRVLAAGVGEALRLQQRFQPYSGFPGRTVRFLEALVQRLDAPIGVEDVVDGFCAESGLPRAFVDPTLPLDTEALARTLQDRVLGQPGAVAAVVDVLLGIKAATTQIGRPMASMLFVGPTGVGKTEMAKALAHVLFGDAGRLTRFDMSEFASPGAVMNLIGGRTGHGLLTAAVRRQPFSVVLFDEVEKADPSFFDLLLQVLGEGRLSDDGGRSADFCSTVVLLTSNIGASEAARGRPGFDREPTDRSETYLRAVQAHFRPEFVNRIDRVLPFSALDPDTIRAILDLHLARLAKRAGFERNRASLVVHDDARDWLAERGYRPEFGARELQRAVRDALLIPVSDALNQRQEPGACTLHVRLREGAPHVGVEEHRRAKGIQASIVKMRAVAQKAARVRRQSFTVRAGSALAELESALTLLLRTQRRMGEAFWRDAQKSAKLAHLQTAHRDLLAWFELAETTEIEVSLVAMDDRFDQLDAMHALVDAAVDRQHQVLHALRSLLDPTPPVVLGVYGSDAELLHWHAARYEEALQAIPHAAPRVVAHELWHRVDPEPDASPYVQRPIHSEPDAEHRALVGVELEVHGTGAMDLLEAEDGLVVHEERSPTVVLRVVPMAWTVTEPATEVPRPERLHRKGAFSQTPKHRIFKDGAVYDGDLDRDCSAERYVQWLSENLATDLWNGTLHWAGS